MKELIEKLEDLKIHYEENCTSRAHSGICEMEKDCGTCVAQQAIEIAKEFEGRKSNGKTQ